jgi:cell division protease FtsH
VYAIVSECYAKAKAMLEENRDVLDQISDYLYEHETITGKEFMKIFNRLKGIEDDAEDDQDPDELFEHED